MSDQLDLRSLQIVAAVAETGSMLEAPRIVEIARTTISTQAMPRISTLVPWFAATG